MFFLFAILSCCIFTSCEENLEEETLGLSCDNKEKRSKLLGTYIGPVTHNGWRPNDFTVRLSLSNTDCFKIGFENNQGWMSDFQTELSEGRILIKSEKVVERQSDHCNGNYGNTINVTLVTSGSIDIIDDSGPIELEFDFNQSVSNMNGEVLCTVTYAGTLVKQ